MFQPETEDMLPRMAPKPSASMGTNEHTVKPQVPEISILFGQHDGNGQQHYNSHIPQQPIKNNTQQTYASWKKQMLPKVTYPAAAQDSHMSDNSNNNNNVVQDYNMPRSNLYPLRRTTTPPLAMPVSTQSNGFGITNGGVTNPLTYRRSLENCSNNMAYQQVQHHQLEQSTRHILPPTPSLTQASGNSARDILTICAGTQTDTISGSSNTVQDIQWSNIASKKDMDDVLQLIHDMRNEQSRIVKMLETLLFSQQMATKAEVRDASTQVNIKEKENLPIVNGGGLQDIGEHPIPTNKFIQHLKPPPNNMLQTPKGKPMAQSTTYRPNSPQRLQEVVSATPIYQPPPNVPNVLTKSSSDTSLAMNELALKYLPNEKLAELLNNLNMDRPFAPSTQNHIPDPSLANTNNPCTPMRGNMENFERASTDISNASYKYLKKYRLLPEDHVDNHVEDNGENENHHTPQYNTPHRRQQHPPQYDNIRNSPIINHTQTPPSPFAGRLPLSPLTRASSASIPQHVVDLENIKHQPKFL